MRIHSEVLQKICERAAVYSRQSAYICAVALDRSVYVRDFSLSDMMLCIVHEDHPESCSSWADEFCRALGPSVAVLPREDGRIYSCLFLDEMLHMNIHFCPRNSFPMFSKDVNLLWARCDYPGIMNNAESIVRRTCLSDDEVECFIMTGLLRATAKVMRGEIFDSIRVLTSVRQRLMRKIGRTGCGPGSVGIRRFEQLNSPWITSILTTIPSAYSQSNVAAAIRGTLALNARLSDMLGLVKVNACIDKQINEMLSGVTDVDNSVTRGETSVGMSEYITTFLDRLVLCASTSGMLNAIGIVGSWLGPSVNMEIGAFDQYSDLDLFLIPNSGALRRGEERLGFVRSIPECVLAFEKTTNNIWALYGDRLLRADCRFTSLDELHRRYENPAILWEKDGCLTHVVQNTSLDSSLNLYPQPSVEWGDTSAWIAIINALRLCNAGRFIEVVDELDYLRHYSLGPLLAIAHGVPCRGVRRIEYRFSSDVERLAGTVGQADYLSCMRCIHHAMKAFLEIRKRIARPYPYKDFEAKVLEHMCGDAVLADSLAVTMSNK